MPSDARGLADEIAEVIAEKNAGRVPGTLAATTLGCLVFKHQEAILAALRQDAGAAMRERCAAICDQGTAYWDWRAPSKASTYSEIAARIRALPLSDPKTASEGRDCA